MQCQLQTIFSSVLSASILDVRRETRDVNNDIRRLDHETRQGIIPSFFMQNAAQNPSFFVQKFHKALILRYNSSNGGYE